MEIAGNIYPPPAPSLRARRGINLNYYFTISICNAPFYIVNNSVELVPLAGSGMFIARDEVPGKSDKQTRLTRETF